jgi:hypothetical protein
MDVAEGFANGKPVGNVLTINGDWRPMRDGIDSAFDISSPEFPYVSGKKIRENVLGQEIEYEPDNIFGASSWSPTGNKIFSNHVDESGKITLETHVKFYGKKPKPSPVFREIRARRKGWHHEPIRHGLARKGIKTGRKRR